MAYYSPITMNYERLLKFTVLVALLSLTLVSGTYAKYTSTATSATDSARVAKWDIHINDEQLGKVDDPSTTEVNEAFSLVFDLFDTVANLKEADGTTDEEHVASANGDQVIAPGTGGSVTFKIQNLSEVTATVTFTVAESNSNSIPLEFKVHGSDTVYATVQAALDAALGLNASHQKTLDPLEASATEIQIDWSWPYQVNGGTELEPNYTVRDGSDTTLGLAGTAVYTVSLTVLAVQVD